MPSICIDGYNLALSQGTGIATYGRNLLTNARAIGLNTEVLYGPDVKRSRNEVLNEVALVDAERPSRPLNGRGKAIRMMDTFKARFGCSAHPIKPSGEVIWPTRGGGRPDADQFWAAPSLFKLASRSFQAYRKTTPVTFDASAEAPQPDVMHWTCPLPLYASDAPNIYTFHDLIPLRLPHTTLDDKRAFMALCQAAVRRADHIAVVSETTRQDLERILKVPASKITNTYQAISIPERLKTRPDEEVRQELEGVFDLQWKDYFLHFGAIEPKKNLGRIVEAYLSSGVKTPLILIGKQGWLVDGETALLSQIKRDSGANAQRIRQYDYMPFPLLLSLIRGAKATLFPSLYEGFGLPVLESMALSTATLASTGGSLPEVAGDAALIVDPYDVQAMARGIRDLDHDHAMREELERRGLIQAAKFTPQAYQQRLKGLYAQVGI